MTKVHNLKISPESFKAIDEDLKFFEIVQKDKEIKVGDLALLQEYIFENKEYTEKKILIEICYITKFEEKDESIIFSFRKFDTDNIFDVITLDNRIRKCRSCGCTWNNACNCGCYWIADDLCSACGLGFGIV